MPSVIEHRMLIEEMEQFVADINEQYDAITARRIRDTCYDIAYEEVWAERDATRRRAYLERHGYLNDPTVRKLISTWITYARWELEWIDT